MKVIIEGENISDIIFNVQFNKGCLSESEAITLSGRRQIDRLGGFRATLRFVVGVVPFSRWQKLPVSVKIEVSGAADSGGEYDMSIEGEIPNPYIFSQNGTDHCANMEILLNEVG